MVVVKGAAGATLDSVDWAEKHGSAKIAKKGRGVANTRPAGSRCAPVIPDWRVLRKCGVRIRLTVRAAGALDRGASKSDNSHVEEKPNSGRLRRLGCFLAVPAILALAGCAGVSSGSQASKQNPVGSQIVANPSTMSFGNVAVGSSSAQKGTLTAGSSDITVSSAAWNGQGYSLSGITFPVTVPAGQSIPFTVTFAPQTAGSTPGSVVFDSNATNSPTTETLTGTGTQLSTHTVALSWNASSSQVIGYNVYRGTVSGGPYSRVNASVDGSTAFTDSAVQSGQTYYYVTTAVDAGNGESPHSNQASASIP
jgi:centrosomal CEP192-like protein